MQVFKVFFKLIKRNFGEILLYLIIFLILAVVLSSVNTGSQYSGFNQTKSRIVFINNDENSAIVDGLEDYLAKNAVIVDMKDDSRTLQDALFYRDIEYIVKVPMGFSEKFYKGSDAKLEITKIPDSISGVYMDNMIDKYLNTARIYVNNMKNISDEELISYIQKDLSQTANVNLSSANTVKEKDFSYYYNYSAYSLSAILILGVCSVMLVFNKLDLKRRNLCSPVKGRSINLQLILGNLVFAFGAWFIVVIVSMLLYKKDMFTLNGILMILNSFIFTIATLSISFLISNIIKSRPAMSAAANVVALGSSFISGVFVPQYLLSAKVLTIASFTPTYWYVKANIIISSLSQFNAQSLKPVFTNMLIVFAFAVAVLAITLVVMKQRKTVS
ncbi:MAG: ABC transporter permease [Eubacteriaceae bacterium]|nr:ABC transporter permease [Eubacteriaceae bacterium]